VFGNGTSVWKERENDLGAQTISNVDTKAESNGNHSQVAAVKLVAVSDENGEN